MAIFGIGRVSKAPLVSQLDSKGESLRYKEADEAEAAKNFLAAAKQAEKDSAYAAMQASAVERARAILADANVTV